MAAEDVGGISLEFNVDTAGFSAGIAKMREELNGLKAAAQRIEVGVATRGVTGSTRTAGGVVQPIIGAAGAPGGTGAAPAVSPRFVVSAGSVRQLRTDINAQMRALHTQGESVQVNVTLGRVAYASMRNQISQGIGDVPIRGLTISPAVIANALRQVSAAVVAQSSAAAGIPRRAAGGAVSGPVIVGERRPELFIPTGAGRMLPNVPHAERGSRTAHSQLTQRQANFTGNLRAAARALEPRHIQGGQAWYTDARNYGLSQAAKYGVDPTTAIGALAALSAGTSWEANKTKFDRILRSHASGQAFPYSRKLDAHAKAQDILSGALTPQQAFRTSPKVGQFFGGLMGDLDTLTLDRWATRTASRGALDQPGRGRGRARMERSWRRVAAEHGMQNAPFQAALWLLEKEGGVPRAGGGPVDEFESFRRAFGRPPVEHGASSMFMRGRQLAGTRAMSRDRIRGLYEPYNQPRPNWWELKEAGVDPSLISRNWRGGRAEAYRQTIAQGGGTFMSTGEQPHRGYAVGMQLGSASIVDQEDRLGFIRGFRGLKRSGAPNIGTWLHEGQIHIDPIVVERRKRAAFKRARENEQLAIYDLRRGEELATRNGGGRVHMAQGGPARRGGLPRGMRVEFVNPDTGERLNKEDAKILFRDSYRPEGRPKRDMEHSGGTEEELFSAVVRNRWGRTLASSPFSYDYGVDALHPESTWVDPAWRRKGLATAMYVKAERFTGRPVMPSETQTPFGRALWSQGGRPFGKGFSPRRELSDFDREYIANEMRPLERLPRPSNPINKIVDMLRRSQLEEPPLRLSSSGAMSDAGPLTRRIEKRRKAQIFARMHEEVAEVTRRLNKRASGGNANHGLYIVNELGRETFVPKSSEHLIPPEVGARIPGFKRSGGGRTGGPGPSEINGVGPMLWQAPEDGWIIPSHLKNKVPPRHRGGPADAGHSHPHSNSTNTFDVDENGRRVRNTGRTPNPPPGFMDYLGLRRSRPIGPAVPRGFSYTPSPPPGAGAGTPPPGTGAPPPRPFANMLEQQEEVDRLRRSARLTRESIDSRPPISADFELNRASLAAKEAAAISARTGRSSLGSNVIYRLGGGRARAEALEESRQLGLRYTRATREPGTDTLEALGHALLDLDAEAEHFQKTILRLDTTTDEGRQSLAGLNDDLDGNRERYKALREEEKVALGLREKQGKALERATGGALRSFASVTAAGFAFNIGMQGVQDAFALAAKAGAPLIDQVTGFGATSQRVTKALSAELPQAGTVSTLFARAGTGAGLSSQATDFLQQRLGASVTAKAGGAAAGQASDLFRAALNKGAPTGLVGGYGGLFGTSLLGSELGGGKGFNETIAGDVAASAGRNSSGLIGDLTNALGRGVHAVTAPLFGDDPTRQIVTVSQDQLKVQGELLDNFNEAVGRGRTAQGGGSAGLTLKKVGIGSADAEQVIAAEGLDEHTRDLARSGIAFVDTAGKVVTNVEEINKAWAAGALGSTLPDQATFAAGQAQQLSAQEALAASRGELQRGVEIPGQLGQQLAAQPFMDAMTGISDASLVTIANLETTQNLQNRISQEGREGLEAQAKLVDEMLGGGKGSEFRSLTTQVAMYGGAIADINAAITNRQAALGKMQYVNQIRLIDRSIGDSKGFLGRAGGSAVGRAERRQFDLSRESQQLGFASTKLQRAADSLSLAMNQRQINFQVAIAGFQAPGITGEERAARIAEAKLEAEYAQKQQNIAMSQFGIGGQQLGIAQQQFGIEGQLAMAQAGRQLEDLERQKAIAVEQYAVEQEQLAAQKRIAALTVAQSQLQARAQSLFNEATGNFDSRLNAASQYVATFGGTMEGAIDAVRGAIIRLNELNGGDGETLQGEGDRRNLRAVGGAFITNGPTTAMYGEAGTEAGIFLRNPRPFNPANLGGGGGGTIVVQIDVHDNQFKGEGDEDRLVRKISNAVKESMSTEASLLGIAS